MYMLPTELTIAHQMYALLDGRSIQSIFKVSYPLLVLLTIHLHICNSVREDRRVGAMSTQPQFVKYVGTTSSHQSCGLLFSTQRDTVLHCIYNLPH